MGKRVRLSDAQRNIMEMASRHTIIHLSAREERTAFILSKKGLLYACQGLADYAITPEGMMALAENRK